MPDPENVDVQLESVTNGSGPIALQVGEQRFYASKDTLSGSGMLRAKIARCWESDKQADGSYFLDADPEIFKHILRFLRHGTYPLCYDMVKGHDVAMYTAIRQQAAYLLVQKLVDWLSNQRYLQAVSIQSSTRVVEDIQGPSRLGGTTESNVKVQYYPSWRTEKRYVCPRGIAAHYDNPRGCGQACRKAQGDAENEYEDCPLLSTLLVEEKMVFNRQLCVEE